MSVPLFWGVVKGGLPRHLRFAAAVLAMVAKDTGDGIYIGTDTLAKYLGLQHRQTAGKLLAELEALGVLETVKRGGRWRGSKSKVTARHSSRRLNVAALEAFGRNCTVARSGDHVTAELPDTLDHATPQLREDTDHATQRLPLQTVRASTNRRAGSTDRDNATECLTQPRGEACAASVPARRRRIKTARPARTQRRCSQCQNTRLAVHHGGHQVFGRYVCSGCFSDPAVRGALGIECPARQQQEEEAMEAKA